METLTEKNMFRGKNLMQFFKTYQDYYALLLEIHGEEKIIQVYKWMFRFLSQMQWGQWLVVQKICPKREMRGLFYWSLECIYQSDLLSQMEFDKIDSQDGNRQLIVRLLEPTDEQKEQWRAFLPAEKRSYNFIDWYSRLLENPQSHPDFNPDWLQLI